MYFRQCPSCSREITHKSKVSCLKSIKLSVVCVKCARNARPIKTNLSRVCPSCKELITYKRSDSLRRAIVNNTFCKKCYSKPLSKEGRAKITKALYLRWKTSPKNSVLYTKGQLSSWSKLVRKRDKTCICGASEQLEAHHILSKGKHPELALNINNGLTMCASCHKEEHRLNGYL